MCMKTAYRAGVSLTNYCLVPRVLKTRVLMVERPQSRRGLRHHHLVHDKGVALSNSYIRFPIQFLHVVDAGCYKTCTAETWTFKK